MEIKTGKLICPYTKCQHNGMNGYKFWIAKKYYDNNNKSYWKYILYHSSEIVKKWHCFSICSKEKDLSNPPKYRSLTSKINDSNSQIVPIHQNFLKIKENVYDDRKVFGGGDCSEDCCEACCGIIVCLIFVPILIPFYLLIFLWIDIYNYNNKTKTRYNNVEGYKKNSKEFILDKVIISKDIWKVIDGLTEEEWKQKKPFKCPKCHHEGETILDFINIDEKDEKVHNTSMNNLIDPTSQMQEQFPTDSTVDINQNVSKNETKDTNNTSIKIHESGEYVNIKKIIAIIFTSPKFQIAVCCQKTDKFSEVLKKFFEKNPDLQNKNFVYLYGGQNIDINQTIEEIKIKDGEPICVNEFNEI